MTVTSASLRPPSPITIAFPLSDPATAIPRSCASHIGGTFGFGMKPRGSSVEAMTEMPLVMSRVAVRPR